jgi:hypothetical protein
MKKLDVSVYGVCEMTQQELLKENGGSLHFPCPIGLGTRIFDEISGTWIYVEGDFIDPRWNF